MFNNSFWNLVTSLVFAYPLNLITATFELCRSSIITRGLVGWGILLILKSSGITNAMAFDDEILIGVAVMSRKTKKLFNLIVNDKYRGLGIGKTMMGKLSPILVRCKTDMSSGNPIDFYNKLGYVHIGNYDLWGNKALTGKNKNIAWMLKDLT